MMKRMKILSDIHGNITGDAGTVDGKNASDFAPVEKAVYIGELGNAGTQLPKDADLLDGHNAEYFENRDTATNTVNFEENAKEVDINTGETHATIFGKILKSIKTFRNNIGNMALLHTLDKTNLVNAINSVNDKINNNLVVSRETLSQSIPIFNTGTGKDKNGEYKDFRDIVEGQNKVRIEGFTAQNIINNGNFKDATNWSSYASTTSFSNNIAINTANGGSDVSQLYTKDTLVIKNHVYYVNVRARVTNSDCTNMQVIFLPKNIPIKTLNSPAKDVWYILSGLGTATESSSGTSNGHFYVMHNYVDAATANGKVMEISNYFAIDLTATFGAGNEPTKEQCDAMFNHYFDGLQGVGSCKLISTGKNLFSEKWRNGDWNNPATPTRLSTDAPILVKRGKTYTISTNNDDTFVHSIGLVDAKSGGSLITAVNWGVKTFTPAIDCWAFPVLKNTGETPVNINDVINYKLQIEEGSIATNYEPYQSSELITSLPQGMQLHRLPNGVCDTVEEVNGVRMLIKRTKGNVFNGNSDENWAPYTGSASVTFTNTIAFNLFIDEPISLPVWNSNKIVFSCFERSNEANNPWSYDIETCAIDNNRHFIVRIQKSKLITLDVAGFKTWLQSNPIKVIYELADSVVYLDDKVGFHQDGNLETFKNGITYFEPIALEESVNPGIIDITYNLTNKTIQMSNSEKITALSKKIVGGLKNGKNNIESGILSNTEGENNQAIGNYSHAEGVGNTIEEFGYQGHAEGAYNLITGYQGHAEGYKTKATGSQSHAEGYVTTASGPYSHAEGNTSSAIGNTAHAEGHLNTANGNYSHVTGHGNIANGQDQHVSGRYNAPSTSDLLQVGNGNSDADRSNAMRLDVNGNLTIAGNYITDGPVKFGRCYFNILANYFTNITSAGIKFKTNIPRKSANLMCKVIFEGYDYGNKRPMHIELSFYNYLTSDAIINAGYSSINALQPVIKMGYENDKVVIWMGYTLNYVTIAINAIAGTGGTLDIFRGWTYAIEEISASAEKVITVPYMA